MNQLMSAGPDLAERARLDLPEFWGADEQYVLDVFAQMRREEPVFWCDPGGFWVLSKYEDQRLVGRSPELFSNSAGFLLQDNFEPTRVAPQLPDWAQEPLLSGKLDRVETRRMVARAKMSMGDPTLEHFINLDPPRHEAYRKVLTNALSQRLIRSLGDQTAQITDDVIAKIVPGSTVDFVDAISSRVPATLMAALLGIPEGEGRERFFRGSTAFMQSFDLSAESNPDEVKRLTALSADFVAYQGELLEDRQEHPQDDMVTRIVQSEIDGEQISGTVAMMFTTSLIVGGADTNKHLMSHIARGLAKHPDQRAILLERPELIPNAVEEVLRYYTVAWHNIRTATARTEIRGKVIEKGDLVVMAYASGNRDEDVFERADEFDVTRTFEAGNQAFGWGQHRCPGAALAMLEGELLLDRMLTSFPNWTVVDDSDRYTSFHQNGFRSLEVNFAA
jgi:cytochrome P450